MSVPYRFDAMESRTLRLLKFGAIERRRGGWRFGTRRIADQVIARLLAQGRARTDGNRVWLPSPGAAE